MAFPRKLKIAPKTLPTIAGNASTVFPASLLSASASLHNHLSSFGGEPPTPPLPPKAPVIARTIVEMVTEMQSGMKTWLCLVHKIRYELFLPKMYFYQEPFQGFA